MEIWTFGEHLTIEGGGGEYVFLNDRNLVAHCLRELPMRLGMQPLIAPSVEWVRPHHVQDPGGWSGFVIISGSHLCIHTFPSCRFLSVDVYICRHDTDPDFVMHYFSEKFGITDAKAYFMRHGVKHPVGNLK